MLELSGAPEHRGKLDPLAIGLAELREELASSYLLELLRDPPPAWENAIDRAVRDAVRAGERSLLSVVERLQAQRPRRAREAGEALEVVSDFGLARLGFGAGEAAGLEAASSVTTIRTPGLTLPEPGTSRETYTRAERVSVATLSLIAALALRLISDDRSRHKLVLLDEAWFLLASTQGRSLLNRLVRLGRSLNATILLATQRLADLGDLSELVGTYFLFGQDSARRGRPRPGADRPRPGRRGAALAADRIPPGALPDARPRRPGRRAAVRPRLPRAARGARHHAPGRARAGEAAAAGAGRSPGPLGLLLLAHPAAIAATSGATSARPRQLGGRRPRRPLPARQLRARRALHRGLGRRLSAASTSPACRR